MYIYILALVAITMTWMRFSNPPGKTWPSWWPCRIFRLIGRAITMTSRFGVTCVRCGLWLSSRVSALHSLVTGSISSGGGQCIHSWWNLIRSKQQSSVSGCHAQVFAGFSGHDNSIPLLKKKMYKVNFYCKVYLFIWIRAVLYKVLSFLFFEGLRFHMLTNKVVRLQPVVDLWINHYQKKIEYFFTSFSKNWTNLKNQFYKFWGNMFIQ